MPQEISQSYGAHTIQRRGREQVICWWRPHCSQFRVTVDQADPLDESGKSCIAVLFTDTSTYHSSMHTDPKSRILVRLLLTPSTQNSRPKPHEKPATWPRRIRDLTTRNPRPAF